MIGLFFAIIILNASGKHVFRDVPRENRPLIMLRSLIGTIGFTTLVFSVQILPLFIVQIIYNMSPFWAGLIAYVFLGESVNKT